MTNSALAAAPRSVSLLPGHAPTRRTLVGIAALVLALAGFGWRLRNIAREPREAVAPRAEQLMYNRMLSLRIRSYAARYGRPPFYLDSVVAHLDSTDARLVADLRTDLWGEPVIYFWTYCSFRLISDGGLRRDAPAPAPEDTIRPGRFLRFAGDVEEEYPWPRGVGRTEHCGEP